MKSPCFVAIVGIITYILLLSKTFRNIYKHTVLVIQKTYKGNKVVTAGRTKYLEGVKSLFSESSKFLQLTIDEEDKWINFIINTEIKVKDHFKVHKNEDKISD